MIFIKIGGSTLRNINLEKCLNLIVNQKRKILIIPGGGSFANLVRKEQKSLGFDDLIAHNLSILSMIKVSYIFESYVKGKVNIVKNIDEFSLSDVHSVGIWNPEKEIKEFVDETTNWENTSDSLALKASQKFNVKSLIIIKSCALEYKYKKNKLYVLDREAVDFFSNNNILDKAFSMNSKNCKFPIYLISIDSFEELGKLILKL